MRNPAPHPDKKGRPSLSGLRSFRLALAGLPVQRPRDLRERLDVLGVVEVGVDPFGRGDFGMAKPLLDVLHWHSLVPERGRAGMAEVVEADLRHPVALEQLPEVRRDPVRPHQVPVLENIDIVIELMVASAAEQLLHLVPLHLHLEELVRNEIAKRVEPILDSQKSACLIHAKQFVFRVALDAVAKKIGSVPCGYRFFLCAVGSKIRSHAPEGDLCSPQFPFFVKEDAGFPGKGLRVGVLVRQRMALVLDLADLGQGGFLLREVFVIPEAAAGFRLPVQFPSCSYQFFSAVKAPAEIINLRPSFLARQLPAGIPFQNFQTANPERLEFYIHVSILL